MPCVPPEPKPALYLRTCKTYQHLCPPCRLQDSSRPAVVVDVRPAEQFRICHLPGAVHAPYAKLDSHLDAIRHALEAAAAAVGAAAPSEGGAEAAAPAAEQGQAQGSAGLQPLPTTPRQPVDLYVVCRRGNDSQRAVARLRQLGITHGVDVVGGMEAWATEVDPSFPTY